jgi:PAS domain S-box-containing protein
MEIDKPVKILFAEDNPDDLELAMRELSQNGIEHTALNVISPVKFIEALHNFKPDIIISDLRMPFFDGIQTLQFSLLHNPDIPFIMLTGSTDEETAVACMKAGATDYIIKDRLNMLPFSVKDAIQNKRLLNEKQEVERVLAEEEKKYRLLFETMTQGVIYYSPRGEILSVNPAAERILGYDAERLKGIKLSDVKWKTIYEDGNEFPVEFHPAILAYKGKRKINNVIMGIIKPNKHDIIWLDVSAVPQFDEKTNFPYQVYTTFEDISEKMKTQLALKTSEEKFRLLFEEMNNGLALHEVVFNEDNRPIDFKYINVNSTFEKLMGINAFDIIGKTMYEINPDFDVLLLNQYCNVAIYGEPIQLEEYNKELGKYFDLKVYCPLKNQFAIIYQDITAKKKS